MNLTPKQIKERIDTFITNVNLTDAHESAEICANEILEYDEDFPILEDPDVFIDCLVAYFESVEKYEMCGRLEENRDKLRKKLIPLGQYFSNVSKQNLPPDINNM